MSRILDKHAPVCKRTITIRPSKPWYNNEIAEAKHYRKQLERKWRKTKSTSDRQLFVEQRLRVTRLIDQAKTDYYGGKITECADDQKSLFKIVEQLLHNKGPEKFPTHNDSFHLAETFSSFFINKIVKIRDQLDIEENSTCLDAAALTNEGPPVCKVLEEFVPLTEEEVSILIAKSPSKSCELDPLPTSILKEHLDLLLPTITSIVNMSLTSSIFPQSMKTALVRPLLKKASLDQEIMKHYRPVSNLSFLSKVIEKAVSLQISDHLSSNNLYEPYQSAYRRFHGTETALLHVQNDILRSVDNKMCVFLVLLDLSAAFDTVDHNIILTRLSETFGITNSALEWIQSYLMDRSQRVNINGILSSPVNLPFGVPQGSVLGPQFFIMYTGPIANIARKFDLQVHLYADDTQLYFSFNPQNADEEHHVINKIEKCVAEIKLWMKANKLKLNDEKTELLIISSRQRKSHVIANSIQIGNNDIVANDSIRNLGIMFDSTMSMEDQVKKICQASYFHLRNIRSIRKYLSQENTEKLIHAFVSSRLDNGNSLLYGISKTLIHRLQLIQNAAARTIYMIRKYDHISPSLRQLHWLPIQHRIIFKICLLTWKALHDMSPVYIKDLLVKYEPAYTNLRSHGKNFLLVPRTSLKSFGDRAFSSVAPMLWNSLPDHLRLCNNLNTFKTMLKTHLFNDAFC